MTGSVEGESRQPGISREEPQGAWSQGGHACLVGLAVQAALAEGGLHPNPGRRAALAKQKTTLVTLVGGPKARGDSGEEVLFLAVGDSAGHRRPAVGGAVCLRDRAPEDPFDCYPQGSQGPRCLSRRTRSTSWCTATCRSLVSATPPTSLARNPTSRSRISTALSCRRGELLSTHLYTSTSSSADE